ncbi:MAG: mechanosensitive ion channel family protein [Bacteroidota bacterium]
MKTSRFFYFATGLVFLTSTILLAQPGDSINSELPDSSTTDPVEVYYVKFDGDTLIRITESLGPYTARERAKSLRERLDLLKKKERIYLDSFSTSELDNFSIVSYMNQPIYYVSDQDAVSYGKSRQEAASETMEIIKSSLTEVLERRTVTYWLKHIGFTLLALLGLIIILFLLNKSYKWVNKKLSRYERDIKRKRKSFLRYLLPRNTKNVFLLISKIVRIALIILILFLYLPLLFSFLPWTERLVNQFYSFLAQPVKDILNGLLNFLPNLFYIFVIIVIARYVVRVFTTITKEIEEDNLVLKGFHKDWAKPTFNIIKIVLYAFTLVFIFPYLPGSDSPAFKGVSIFLGVLFSLGSTSAIANIVAGIVITYMRPYVIGDRVKIGESVGDIIEKNLLVTRMRTVKNEDITIPNATIINSHLWNYSKNASSIGIILHPTVTIGYDVPSQQVIDLLLKAAQNTKELTRDLKPFVLQKSLSDFYVEYELNVYTKQPKKMAHFYSELNKSILNEFNAAGVEILSPHYSALRDGNASTIPSESAPTEPSPAKNPVDMIIHKVTGKK